MKVLENSSNYIEIELNNKIYLISYTTNVAVYDKIKKTIKATKQFYSRTTSKHINTFIKKYS